MTPHEESDAPRSQDSVTGGAGGPAVSHACSAMISEPGFFLDLGKARLLVNSSPQPGGPACKARSIIGLKSFTFSVSNHRFSALAHANISSSDLERRSCRSATAITSWPSPRSSAAMAGENISSSRSLTSGRWFIRNAAWRPRPSGRGGNAASPPRKCQWYSLVCSHVPVPAAPHARPGSGAAGPLRPRPVRMEPGRRATRPLAPGPQGRAGLPGAVPPAHRRPGRAPVAGRRLPDGPAAGAARLRPGDDGVLRPGEPGRAAVVAQGRAG